MKAKRLLLIGLIGSLMLTGCNNSASSSSSSSQDLSSSEVDSSSQENSSSSEKEDLDDPKLWNENAKSLMKQELNEVLPYIELGQYEVLSSKNPRNETVVHIIQKNSKDLGLTEKYSLVLQKYNYTYLTDNDVFKIYEKENDDKSKIQVTFGYFKGNEDVEPGFQINACYIIPLSFTTSWTNEEKALLNEHLHELIPDMKLTNKHEMYYDKDTNSVVVKDMYATSNLMDEYLSILVKKGYVKQGDEYGFNTYDKPSNDDELYYISIDPYDYNKLGAVGIELYIRRLKDIRNSTSWPKKEIDAYFSNDPVIKTIPSYDGAEKYVYYHKDGMFSVKCLSTSEKTQAYLKLFEPLNFELSYIASYNTYRVVSQDKSVVLLISFTNSENYPELSIEIYKL